VAPLGLTVARDLQTALAGRQADVAVITSVSSLALLEKQVLEAAQAGLNIVSTCEELSFPWHAAPEIARRLDAACKQYGVACVGTGVNPGFLMDYLPCVLSSVCQHVEHVGVTRVQDASSRRVPFQRKIGAGLTLPEFKAKVAEGTLRHVGLTESMHMIAHCFNWRLDRTTESLEPVLATRTIRGGHTAIKRGMVCGVEQIGRSYLGEREVICLHFRAAVGEPEAFDTVEIKGTPCIRSTIAGGVNGDTATCAITLNTVRAIVRTTPGLHTMLDLPVPGYAATHGERGVADPAGDVIRPARRCGTHARRRCAAARGG
jgi:4-hydroxy-tetrahydrodipicolinate reductase